MNVYASIVGFFHDGGFFMYPIALVLAAGLAVAIERYIYLSKTAVSNQVLWRKITPFIQGGKFTEAAALTSKSGAVIGSILTYGLDRTRTSSRRDDIEKAMEESLMEVLPRLESRTHYLATFANVATLLGLLGTISGLIHAFSAMEQANAAEKADLLSASIAVAMNCTAFGLMVAIPLVLVHTFLQSKTTRIIDSLEMVAVKFLNAVDERKRQQVPA